MTSSRDPSFGGLTNGLAEELGEVTQSLDGEVTTYARAGSLFARCSSSVLEVRLPEDIAEAALRTPDTAAIADDQGWIRFAPSSGERHVFDRAEAWFRTAWRHAHRG
ncbi:MAG: hypothetical protein ACC726_14010 [Chloroflexota bacterium]